MPRCLELLDDEILPVCQYFAYIETAHWRALQRHRGDAGLARLHRGRRPQRELRHAAGGGRRRTSSRCSTSLFSANRRRSLRRLRWPRTDDRSRHSPRARATCAPLFDGRGVDLRADPEVYDAMGEIALGELGLDIYPNQIEVITAEQMLDAYSSIGMPLMYRHWSFGKRFAATRPTTSAACAAWPTSSSSTPTPASATSWRRTP